MGKSMANWKVIHILRGPGGFLRASLGLPAPPTDAEIDAAVDATVRTFPRAYAVG
jgi:hypothetical protein